MALQILCDNCEKPYGASDLNTVVKMSRGGVTDTLVYLIDSWCPNCQERQRVDISEKSVFRDMESDQILTEFLKKRFPTSGSDASPADIPSEKSYNLLPTKPPFPTTEAEKIQARKHCMPLPPGISPFAQTVTEILRKEGRMPDENEPPGPSPSRSAPVGPGPERKD